MSWSLLKRCLGTHTRLARESGIAVPDLHHATKDIVHNSEIRSSRHPGQTLSAQREPTPAELALCERIADAFIDGYAKS